MVARGQKGIIGGQPGIHQGVSKRITRGQQAVNQGSAMAAARGHMGSAGESPGDRQLGDRQDSEREYPGGQPGNHQ